MRTIPWFALRRHLGIIMVLSWWVFWLIIHNTNLSGVIVSDLAYQSHFMLMLFSMFFGYVLSVARRPVVRVGVAQWDKTAKKTRTSTASFFFVCLGFCGLALLVSAALGNAFSLSPAEYFSRIRGAGEESLGSMVTGYTLLDYGLKLFVYPVLLALLLVCLLNIRNYSRYLFIVLLFIAFYSYIYQVNYPFIFIFFSFLFSVHAAGLKRDATEKSKTYVLILLVLLFLLIFASAVNRYGSLDILGVVGYYFINYHTLGFYLYQSALEENNSGFFTYGLSSLGPLSLYLSLFLEKVLEYDLLSTYSLNVSESAKSVVAMRNGRTSNAFVTVLLTFYKDFWVFGLFLGGFIYGASLGFFQARAGFGGVIYLYLLVLGVISIYVSPFEQPYLWLTPFVIRLLVPRIRYNA